MKDNSPPASENLASALGLCPRCEAPNEYSSYDCTACGARLPWAWALDKVAQETQSKFERAEERFERIAEAASGIVYEWQYATGNLRRFGNIASLLGYHPDEVESGTDWWMNLIHPEDQNIVKNVLYSALEDGASFFSAEYRVRCKNGEYIWLWDRGSIQRDEAGNVESTIGQTTDITKYKEALLRFEVSEERSRRLVDANIVGVLFCDLDGVIRDANDAFLQIIGYQRSDLENGKLNWQNLTPPGHEAADDTAIEQLKTSGAVKPYEKEYWHRDGHSVPILVGAAVLQNSSQAVAFIHDLTQQKAAENALRRSEERYRMVSELTSDFTYLCTIREDGTLFIEWVTDSFTRITGYTHEEIQGDSWQNAIYPADLPRVIEFVGHLMGGNSDTIEYRIYTKEDDLRWVQIHGRPLFDENGRVAQLLGAGQDITERRRAHEELRESEERFRRMADHAPVLLWVSDTSGGCTWFNKPWSEFVGRPLEKDLGDGWTQNIHPDDFQQCVSTYKKAFDARQNLSLEYRLRRYDGQYRWVLDTSCPRWSLGGEFMGYIGSCIDITERKHAEEQQQFLAKASNVLASSLDYATVVRDVTKLALPYFADYCFVDLLEQGEVTQIAIAHTEPEKESLIRELRERNPIRFDQSPGVGYVIRTGEAQILPDFNEEVWRRYTQDEYSIELTQKLNPSSYIIYPLRARGHTIGAITFVLCKGRRYNESDLLFAGELADRAARAVDNSRLYRNAQEAQRQAETAREQAEAARSEAEAANRAKDEFLATVSHELRTPLNAILGWSNLLQSGGLDEASTQQALETIERNARAQTQIVSDLLDVSRIITGKLRLDTKPLALLPIAESALDSMQSAATAKGVTLELHPDAHDVFILGDATRLHQVLWNLLSNAVRFTPSGGCVTVELKKQDAMAHLSVADTGQGITPEFLPYVFDRFRQAESSYTRKYSGLGLGLAIVRHIAEMHGGTVEAWSEGLNRGARFTVKLPLFTPTTETADSLATPVSAHKEPSQTQVPAELSHDDSLRVLSGRRILVVDDQEDARVLVSNVLQAYNTTVETAASASEALLKLQSAQFDALISDIGMPGEDGYSLIQKIRAGRGKSNNHIPALAFSAFAREEDKQRALNSGFNDYHPKPISPPELIIALTNLIEPSP